MPGEGNQSQKLTHHVILFKCPEETDLQTEADSWLAGAGSDGVAQAYLGRWSKIQL